jgi:zinc/manganese transport system substrate-binding protein
MRPILTSITIGVAAAVAVGACGDDDGEAAAAGNDEPLVVVTSTILGDIVSTVAGDAADVEVLLPIGADPHDFAPSARQAEAMGDADLLVQNGAGFEEGLSDSIDNAADAGVELFTVADHVDLIDDDPHLWTDPTRLVPAVDALGVRLTELTGDAAVAERAATLSGDLADLDEEIEALLADIPERERVLVTNHEVFAYFADRYGFEVVGAVVPATTTRAEPSAADVESLAETITREGVRAIFVETTSNADLAEALADSVGNVEVVTLFTESLGEPGTEADTYLGMMRADAQLIHDALV